MAIKTKHSRPTTGVMPGPASEGAIILDDADDAAWDAQATPATEREPITAQPRPISSNERKFIAKARPPRMVTVKPKPPEVPPKPDESIIKVEAVKPTIPGIPSIEDDAELKAAREKFDSINQQYRAVRSKRLDLAESLGLDQSNYDDNSKDRIAGNLLARGIPTTGIDSLADLERDESRLRLAAVAAAAEIPGAIHNATERCNRMVPAILAPLKRAVALAVVAAVKANQEHKRIIAAIDLCGLSPGQLGAIVIYSRPFDPAMIGNMLSAWLGDSSLQPADIVGLEHLIGQPAWAM